MSCKVLTALLTKSHDPPSRVIRTHMESHLEPEKETVNRVENLSLKPWAPSMGP